MPTTVFNFDTPSNYTYDTDKIEITGSVAKLKDLRPSNARFYVPFTADLNAAWGTAGDLEGVGNGGIGVSGGNLVVDNIAKYVDYDATVNVDSAQRGCIRMRVTPTYAGNPASDVHFVAISKAHFSPDNLISIYHSSGGNIVVSIKDSSGSAFVSISAAWSQVQDQQYEIELNYDISAGSTRLFIDGVQVGSTNTGTGTRDSNINLLRIAQDITLSVGTGFKMSDFLFFNTVQHTGNYTPDWSNIFETIYDITNPQITINATFTHDAIEAFTEVSTKLLADEIQYIIEVDSVKTWHNGSAWVTSDGTYAQSNTEEEIVENMSSLTSVRVNSKFIAFIHSEDGDTTPELDSLTVTYNFAGTEIDEIERCAVWFYSRDGEGLISTEDVTFRIPPKLVSYKDNIILREDVVTITPESDGYVEANLIETGNMTTIDGSTVLYEVEIDNKKYYFEVPNQENALLFDLITA